MLRNHLVTAFRILRKQRIEPDIWTLVGAALLALLIAGFTVSGQALRAARADPARNLRYE